MRHRYMCTRHQPLSNQAVSRTCGVSGVACPDALACLGYIKQVHLVLRFVTLRFVTFSKKLAC